MKEQIKRGQIFSGNELAEKLPENHGVVVLILNGKDVAYGDSHSDEDILNKNFIGAKRLYGDDKSFLIMKRGGIIFRQK